MLKAVSILNEFFSRDSSAYYGQRISYLRPGVTLSQVQSAVNSSPSFLTPSKNRIFEDSVMLQLCEDEYDETSGFWDTRKNRST